LRPELATARARLGAGRRHRVERLKRSLLTLRESYIAGTFEGGTKRAKELLAASTELGYAPGRARALNLLGVFTSVEGKLPEAHGFYESAYFAAQGVRDDDLALMAATNLVSNAWRRGDSSGALYWARQGRAGTDSTSDPIEVAKLESAESIALISLGRTDDALERLRRVLDTRSSLLGANHPQTADAQFTIGNAQLEAGDLESALTSYNASREKHERALGAHHPSLAFTHHNVGNVQFHLGNPDGARKSWERALKIEEEALGPDHERLGGTLANLATAANEANDPERALAYAERSQAILEAEHGSQHPDLIQTLTESGKAHLALDQVQTGRAAFEAAIEIGRSAFDGHHEAMLGPLAGAARAAWAMGDGDAALRHSRQLLELEWFSSDDPGSASDALWIMARAQSAVGQSREAKRTANRALTGYATAGDDDAVAAMTTWLETLDD
ncbi:MAG: tetratricopeptide repeat protein, partial [Nannocystaceae bacterium]|nr:tetratricopeptide repeat protein [Nannocystaceae bacterium]